MPYKIPYLAILNVNLYNTPAPTHPQLRVIFKFKAALMWHARATTGSSSSNLLRRRGYNNLNNCIPSLPRSLLS